MIYFALGWESSWWNVSYNVCIWVGEQAGARKERERGRIRNFCSEWVEKNRYKHGWLLFFSIPFLNVACQYCFLLSKFGAGLLKFQKEIWEFIFSINGNRIFALSFISLSQKKTLETHNSKKHALEISFFWIMILKEGAGTWIITDTCATVKCAWFLWENESGPTQKRK